MNKCNYALISALYDTNDANLYNDIYFPIIKYEIANQYYTQPIDKYYSLEELQQAINTDFGIKIPLIVLKQSIKAIGKGSNEISISVIDKGKLFQINKAWDISLNVSIDDKSQEITTNFNQLESLFQKFLTIERLSCDKSFLDFYSDNTEEIFNYVEGTNSDVIINENYINLTRFLVWLKKTHKELFYTANNIFWASIIAGFLKREKVDINIKPLEKIEYYLDSSLVLAILDLDSSENVAYGQELLDIIKSSGNVASVHLLTIREIKNILTSVENEQSPRPNTSIEGAYYRRELSPSKILQIKNNLLSSIKNKGIAIFPVSDERELDKIVGSYRSNKIVKDLEQLRTTPYFYSNYNNYNIRDIHDVYLRDFIQKKRGVIANIEKINSYFVSLNTDLISFFQKENPDAKPVIIHPAKIITDLWIHNSNCTLLKKNALTEAMSRCFALNNIDIRQKLRIVSKYYKESDTDYSEEDYFAVRSALINRSTKALKEIEEISTTEQKKLTNKEELNNNRARALIKIARDEDLRKKQDIISLASEKEQLQDAVMSKEQISIQNSERIKLLENELEKEKQKNALTEQINSISDQISELEKEKIKSISMFKFRIIILSEGIFVAGVLLLLPCLIGSFNAELNFIDYLKTNLLTILVFCISAIGFLCRIHNLYLFSPRIQCAEHRKEQEKYWIDKNPKYNELKKQLEKLQTERKSLNG